MLILNELILYAHSTHIILYRSLKLQVDIYKKYDVVRYGRSNPPGSLSSIQVAHQASQITGSLRPAIQKTGLQSRPKAIHTIYRSLLRRTLLRRKDKE